MIICLCSERKGGSVLCFLILHLLKVALYTFSSELVERFNIKSMPTIITFHEGELHNVYVGAVPAAGLRAALNDAQKPKRKGMLRSLFGG